MMEVDHFMLAFLTHSCMKTYSIKHRAMLKFNARWQKITANASTGIAPQSEQLQTDNAQDVPTLSTAF